MSKQAAAATQSRNSLRVFFAQPGRLELAVFVVAVFAFIATIGFPFLFDDRAQILLNPEITSWRGVGSYFVSDAWHSFGQVVQPRYYRPLFFVWLRISYLLFKLQPAGWHVLAALLHGAVSVLAFRVALRLTGACGRSDSVAAFPPARLCAAVAGVLFAVHPVHIESVAWISGITDPLMSLFGLGAMLTFMDWLSQPRRLMLASTVALFALALLSKEPALMLLPMLALLAWLYSDKARRASVLLTGLAPIAAVTVAYFAVRAALFGAGTHVEGEALPVDAAIYTLPKVLLLYVRHALLPVKLSFAYDVVPKTSAGWGFWGPLLLLLAIAALFALWCYRAPRHRRVLIASAAIFVLWLLPVLNLRWLGVNDLMHDRYLYLPVLGVCIMAGVLWQQWMEFEGRSVPGFLQLACAGVLAVLLLAGTMVQEMYCASEVLLWSRAVTISPSSDPALSNLGIVLCERGNLSDALAVFERELQLRPNTYNSNYHMAYGLMLDRRYAAAEPFAKRAVELGPANPLALRLLGGIELHLGRIEMAEQYMRRALAQNSRDDGYHTALGLVLLERGDRAAAEQEFVEELKLFPAEQDAQRGLAAARAGSVQGGR